MSEPRWLTPAQERAWRGYRLMRARLDLQLARDLASQSGLSEADYDVLSNLSDAENHRWRLKDLAARMLWSPSRLSHHLARMEQRGLVNREECREDGRGAEVSLTDQGLRTIETAAPGHVESVRQHLIDQLDPEHVRALTEITEAVLTHLNDLDSGRS